MVVLACAILRHGRHDFRRNVFHVFDNDIGYVVRGAAGGLLRFGKFLNPFFNGKTLRRSLRLKRGRLFVRQFDRQGQGQYLSFMIVPLPAPHNPKERGGVQNSTLCGTLKYGCGLHTRKFRLDQQDDIDRGLFALSLRGLNLYCVKGV